MAKSPRKSQEQSYFERLQFDPSLLKGWVANYIGNIRIVILLIISISILGLVSYFNLPKRLNPEVEIPIVVVSTVLPGASPEDVESLVTIPLENELKGTQGLDEINSVSRDNVSVITTQFVSSVSRDEAKERIQSAVDSVQDLPEDSLTPNVIALDFEDQPIWSFAIISKQNDVPALMKFSDQLKDRIEELSRVDRVNTTGFEEQEIVVTLDPTKVQEYGLNPIVLSQLIARNASSYPAGSVNTGSNSFAVTINPKVESIKDVRELSLMINGQPLRLGEVATIEERAKLNQSRSYLALPNQSTTRAVTFYVYKSTTSSIDEAGKQVATEVEQIMEEYHDQFELVTMVNTSEEIAEQFSDLLGEFRSTILLVFICLLLFLGLRQAVISSFTVPLTFLSAFFFMTFLGMSINFLSLFAFLLTLGLLVDDTIVVVSAMTTYYKIGRFTPMQTGLLVWRDTIVPIWSTTITTIWSFVPLLLASGIIGEFIKPIPIVVTVTMISSTAIAVLITLPIMILVLKPSIPTRVVMMAKILGVLVPFVILGFVAAHNPFLPVIGVTYFLLVALLFIAGKTMALQLRRRLSHSRYVTWTGTQLNRIMNHGVIDVEGFAKKYYQTALTIISSPASRRKTILAILIYSIVCFLLLPLGFVKSEFFPKADGENLFVSLEMPSGTNYEQVDQRVPLFYEELKGIPEVRFITAETGIALSNDGGRDNRPNSLLYTLTLVPEEDRERSSIVIAEEIREKLKHYPAGKVSVIEISGGPPAGADIQITLLGDELPILDQYAQQLVDYLENQSGVTNIDKSIKSGTSQLVFIPDYTKLTEANIGVESLGLWLRSYSTGFTLDELNLDKTSSDKTDVVFKFSSSEPDAEGISMVTVPNLQGQSYPLLSLGHFESRPNPTLITRKDGKRTVAVYGSLVPGYNLAEINVALEKKADELSLPEGYSWQTGGVNEENQKSVESILQAMGVSAILILVTMVIQFGSFRQAFIVLIVIPLAVSSVFLAFALTGTPLSFPALIGVLSLFGIVVTNSMFIVDKINLNRAEGMPLKEAIADAGASRLEPIILTKLATVLGLLPITIADPLWRGLGGAIISGLLISSTIMLLFIPSLYYELFKADDTAVH